MSERDDHANRVEAPGTLVLSFIFLAIFIILWILHFKWIGEIWKIS